MFNDVLKEVTGVLDRRFLLNAFFPSLTFWGLLVVVAFAGAGWDLVKVAQIWNQQDVTFKTLQIVGCLSWVTFFSGILTSQLTAIVRFYEGYWNFPLSRRLAAIGKSWHQDRLKELDFDIQMKEITDKLQQVQTQLEPVNQALSHNSLQPSNSPQHLAQLQKQQAQLRKQETRLEKRQAQLQQNLASLYNCIYLYYPLPTQSEKVMPTSLGNILKNAELYSFERYELDAVLIWPRLYNLLPDRFIQTLAEAKSSLDFMLVISTLGGIFALLSGAYLLTIQSSGWLFLLCFWGGLLVGWLAYRGALGSTIIYAELIKAGFDLYRNELLKQMRLPLPKTPTEEIKQWDEIRQFLYSSNTQVTWQYIEPDITTDRNSP
ncbi:MAG: hypothetical protein JGK03_15350 [Microcoleus sp. PH2017_25_DOB_D_A]|jgi:DNA-binding transcriptional MerR regulator|uniref:hypothetical protein n=1 Tax=unclassified Microcoleus TaxID=2642155 RepID=UPI001D364166|nr:MULTISPECIES: hypothetical protein [unclassified Microcoleus]MCC3509497.1 hypothetical protein [Microcoleus sp. PH2017_17_BER_D_A]TAE40431.1 MAG: hypothetical protein EAZ90_20330 [Oscillatoriales cyanobacterium]MCC3499428.1 hypothetical protein [Microcoleus sp. PH2017_15_JOR_U_A]MCC3535548.1 hypothetical protein [Microcoleus sp. PH2017_25_DOB_D_A]MCC3545484.1 hypothetical protein [Microcoleus sp. PH2017_24_DOB_U_A]